MQFRKVIALLAAGLTCLAGLPAATTHKKKATHTKTTAPPAKRKPRTHVAQTPQKAPARSAHTARPAPAKWHPGQTAPTPDRYREIQDALNKKGYLHGDASGVWNQDSADALRRFQQDQNLKASGKLDSLSIIALGLGPKH